jgi:hypothetical protein
MSDYVYENGKAIYDSSVKIYDNGKMYIKGEAISKTVDLMKTYLSTHLVILYQRVL